MRKKQHIAFILILMTSLGFISACKSTKKVFAFPQEVVSDEKDIKPEDLEKAKAEKARIAEERKKRAAERAELNNVSDENDAPAEEQPQKNVAHQDMPVQADGGESTQNDANVQTKETPKQKVAKNDDLPTDADPQAEAEIEQPEIKNKTSKEEKQKTANRQSANSSGVKDYENVKMSGAATNAEEEAKKKDYATVKMPVPPNIDSLKKLGQPIPADAVNHKTMADAGIKKAPDSLFMLMERTPCKGRPSASYRIEIYYKGNVLYTGYNGVQLKGDHTAVLPTEVLKKIFELAKDAKFYDLQDAYIDENPETAIYKQVTLIAMQVKGKKKLIKDGQTDTPSELVFLEKYIDDVIENVQWQQGNNGNKKTVNNIKKTK